MSLDIEISRDFSAYKYNVEVMPEALEHLCEVAAQGMPIDSLPVLTVVPGPYFGMNLIERSLYDDRQGARGRMVSGNLLLGDYQAGSNHIYQRLNGNEAQANKILRHEVFHWAEDAVFGTFEKDLADAEARLSKYPTDDDSLRGYIRYRRLPYERRARKFASSHQVRELVGNVIQVYKRT